MGKPNSTRRKVAPSLSPPEKPDASTDADHQFDQLQRRFLVLVNQLLLAASDFGDLTWVPEEHVPAALVAFEAAKELSQIFNHIDEWYVSHEHTAKAVSP
jgi:hypothetical protein